MAPGTLESYGQRIEALRERNLEIRQALDREVLRLTAFLGRRREIEPGHMHPALRDLTPRELQVLRCIAEGLSTKETALNLGISFKTAACHRHRIMQKIGVHGTGALVRFAIANGVVTLSKS